MTDSKSEKKEGKALQDASSSDDSLGELRQLLLGPTQVRLEKLENRIDNRELLARDVSRVLPEAISLRSAQDTKIEIVLEPITANAIRSSIRKDRKVLVDALFPIMGPAIRKAIASSFQAMIEGFNQVLEHSLSLKSLKWRLEALRTNKSFAEIVLLHTLIYHVEQIFLIHKDTGLVLQHVVSKAEVAHDPDLVSSMLTAIKDFVQDSFGAQKEESLETLRVGERSVWIEHAPHAFLAAVIRGDPPRDYVTTLCETLEEIHIDHKEKLQNFSGDSTPFNDTQYLLEKCLQAQFEGETKKSSPLVWFIFAAVLGLIGVCALYWFNDHRNWSRLETRLQNEPGIVVTAVKKIDGKKHVIGLRDPLAEDPYTYIAAYGMNSDDIEFRWEAFHSSHPAFITRRIVEILEPPDTVAIENTDGIVKVSGSAPHGWLLAARKMARALPWLEDLQLNQVVDIDTVLQPPVGVTLELQGQVLVVSGQATQQWIKNLQSNLSLLPGVDGFTDIHLTNTDLIEFESIMRRVHQHVVFFEAGSSDIAHTERRKIPIIVEDLQKLLSLAQALNKKLQIDIVGHAESSDSEAINLQISKDRAQALLTILVDFGLDANNFSAAGIGSQEPLAEVFDPYHVASDHRTTIKVRYTPSSQ
jgi:OOP family OmpA-OmpF porin